MRSCTDLQLDLRVRISRLRIAGGLGDHRTLPIQEACGHVVDDGERLDLGLVEAQEGDLPGVPRPPVAAVVATAIDLLLVDPVEDAVEQLLAAVGGDLPLLLGLLVYHHEVVVAHKRGPSLVAALGLDPL
jgi:hypothetical protein